nr:ATP-binding cassette domain-containing protein [Mycolicibacterium smegmatis]
MAIPADLSVRRLSAGQQQLIEIARALSSDARILVLDEPTSAPSAHEVEHLFGIVDALRSRGVAIVFVGHRLDEVYALADRITVLRDGSWVSTGMSQEMHEERVVQDMVGRSVDVLYPKQAAPLEIRCWRSQV